MSEGVLLERERDRKILLPSILVPAQKIVLILAPSFSFRINKVTVWECWDRVEIEREMAETRSKYFLPWMVLKEHQLMSGEEIGKTVQV